MSILNWLNFAIQLNDGLWYLYSDICWMNEDILRDGTSQFQVCALRAAPNGMKIGLLYCKFHIVRDEFTWISHFERNKLITNRIKHDMVFLYHFHFTRYLNTICKYCAFQHFSILKQDLLFIIIFFFVLIHTEYKK